MSIAVLTQVCDETRRLAIAGSSLAPGDFRLKKLIPPLKKSGEKAPVFAKVGELVERLVEGTDKESADNLLNLSTLVSSVLYTQGETGAQGRMKAIETVDLGPPVTGTSARVLKPLIEALTNTGSGRLEIIRDAHERGAFRDMRLVNPTVKAIDDPYGEIGDLIAEKVLPVYGKTIYPEIRSAFDIKGRGGHVRRLKLMHCLDQAATKELVEEALESGSKEMKVAALSCIGDSKDGLPHLLDQVNAKAKDVRTAALEGLAKFKTADAVEALIKALSGKDADIAIGPASKNGSPKLLKFLLDESQAQLDLAVESKAKAKRVTALNRVQTLLQGFVERKDKKSVDFLKGIFDRREELFQVKTSATAIDGSTIVWGATHLLVSTGSRAVLKMLGESHAGLPSEILHCCFVGAAQTMTPKKVYDEYSPYLLAKLAAKKTKNDQTRERREAIVEIVDDVARYGKTSLDGYGYGYRSYYYGMRLGRFAGEAKLDPRWLDAAIKADELNLAISLKRPKHKMLNKYLGDTFAKLFKKRDGEWETSHVLEAMIDVQHPDAIDCFMQCLKKLLGKTRRYYYTYWVGRLIPKLPKEAIAPLEELIPILPDKAVDDIVPQIAELKTIHGS